MTINAATEGELGGLHKKLKDRLVEQLDTPEYCTPALFTSITNFLAKNNITSIEEGIEDTVLQDKIMNMKKSRNLRLLKSVALTGTED